MADIKWIKITTDIFDDEKIKIIDKYPARDEILVIWFKLLALAGRVNQCGLLFINNRIPYTKEMLAAIFNRELNTIEMALTIFEKFGMISIDDNELIAISNWEKHQNIDGLDKIREQSRVRMANSREKQKMLRNGYATGYATVTQCYAIEEELDKELDIDKEVKLIKDDSHIDEFFETIWLLYPKKEGKSLVRKPKRKELYKLGYDKVKLCIDRYLNEAKPEYYYAGKNFFNYYCTDFLDENYKANNPKSDERQKFIERAMELRDEHTIS